MAKSTRLKTHFRVLRHQAKERAYDLWNISLPIFLTTGIICGSVKVWSIVLGLGL